jgi:hypothetical protein
MVQPHLGAVQVIEREPPSNPGPGAPHRGAGGRTDVAKPVLRHRSPYYVKSVAYGGVALVNFTGGYWK